MKGSSLPVLTPRLVVAGAAAAIDFYREVFGAREIERFEDPKSKRIVHAAVSIRGAVLALTDEHRPWHNDAPGSLGGSPVILQLECEDPDAVAASAVARGASVVFPIADQEYGRREGRIKDPFGHLWIVGRELKARS
jgi:PhnB protein